MRRVGRTAPPERSILSCRRMTKVQLEYELVRPLDDPLMDAIARAHGVYGIHRISLNPAMDRIKVEYDASRLSPLEVENRLQMMGIPVALKRLRPSTGESRLRRVGCEFPRASADLVCTCTRRFGQTACRPVLLAPLFEQVR